MVILHISTTTIYSNVKHKIPNQMIISKNNILCKIWLADPDSELVRDFKKYVSRMMEEAEKNRNEEIQAALLN